MQISKSSLSIKSSLNIYMLQNAELIQWKKKQKKRGQ